MSGGEGVNNQSSWIGSVERWVGRAHVWTISLPFLLHPPLTRSPTLLVTYPVRKQQLEMEATGLEGSFQLSAPHFSFPPTLGHGPGFGIRGSPFPLGSWN